MTAAEKAISRYLRLIDVARPPSGKYEFELPPGEEGERIADFLYSVLDPGKLRTLDFSGLKATPASPVLPLLRHHVEFLSLNDCQISVLPDFVGTLTKLRRLEVEDNALTELPHWIGELTQLEVLNLRNNSLTDLPESMAYLIKLGFLDLRDNQFRSLPHFLARLSSLKVLNLHGNHSLRLPAEVLGEVGQVLVTDYSDFVIDPQVSSSPGEILDYYFKNPPQIKELHEQRHSTQIRMFFSAAPRGALEPTVSPAGLGWRVVTDEIGTVVDLDPAGDGSVAYVEFRSLEPDRGSTLREVSAARLKEVGAHFYRARIRHQVLQSGPDVLSKMQFAGPSKEELDHLTLPFVSKETLDKLDS